MIEIYKEILKLYENYSKGAIATVIDSKGSSPQKAGHKMVIREDGTIIGTVGGGAVEIKVIETALEVIKNNTPKKVSYDLEKDLGMHCGGFMEIFIEPIPYIERLIIFGGGHISKPLVKLAKMIGFNVTVIDDRKEFANEERFKEADLILAEDYNNAFNSLRFDEFTWIVIVTRSHQFDEEILSYCVTQKYRYLGMVGSKNKVEKIKLKLKEKGISQSIIDNIKAPIGLPINAITPEEIAVSIIAQIIEEKNKGKK